LLAHGKSLETSIKQNHDAIARDLVVLTSGPKLENIELDTQALIGRVVEKTEKALIRIKHQCILDELRFAEIDRRYEEVSSAEPLTFSWAFHENSEIKTWLRSGNGIFHIAGKPGSGKSTLVKYLYEKAETGDTSLNAWAESADKELVLGKFFFWRNGLPMQRSLKGLFRTLLYESLNKVRDLIPAVFPGLWEELQSVDWRTREKVHLTEKDIDLAFATLVGDKSNLLFERYRFCFFLEGLDECDDRDKDHLDLVRLLFRLTQNSPDDFKLLVSSREENVFQFRLNYRIRLRLQDHTRNDIEELVKVRLDPIENGFEDYTQEDIQRLSSAIVNKADGVFMWVAVVLKTIRDELHNAKAISAIEREIDQLPLELLDLYETILSSIKKTNLRKTAHILAILNAIVKTYPMVVSRESEAVTGQLDRTWTQHYHLSCFYFFETFLRDSEFLQRIPASERVLSREDAIKHEKLAEKSINGYCKGLVEIRKNKFLPQGMNAFMVVTHRSVYEFMESDKCILKEDISRCRDVAVDFVIKSHVAFFLATDLRWLLNEINTMQDLGRNRYLDLDLHDATDMSYLERTDTGRDYRLKSRTGWWLVSRVMEIFHLIRYGRCNDQAMSQILNALEDNFKEYPFKPIALSEIKTKLRSEAEQLLLTAVRIHGVYSVVYTAAYFHLNAYVSQRLAEDENLKNDDWNKAMLLECALKSIWRLREPSTLGLEAVLAGGVSPNLSIYPEAPREYVKPASAWQKWLRDLTEGYELRGVKWTSHGSKATALLLEYDADTNVRFHWREPDYTEKKIRWFDEEIIPSEEISSSEDVCYGSDASWSPRSSRRCWLSWSDGVELPITLDSKVYSYVKAHLKSSKSLTLRQYFESIPDLPHKGHLLAVLDRKTRPENATKTQLAHRDTIEARDCMTQDSDLDGTVTIATHESTDLQPLNQLKSKSNTTQGYRNWRRIAWFVVVLVISMYTYVDKTYLNDTYQY
jgi:hypothetical protein